MVNISFKSIVEIAIGRYTTCLEILERKTFLWLLLSRKTKLKKALEICKELDLDEGICNFFKKRGITNETLKFLIGKRVVRPHIPYVYTIPMHCKTKKQVIETLKFRLKMLQEFKEGY